MRHIEEDWKADSAGESSLTRTRFGDAFFQLADTWTHGVCAREYADFLRSILMRVSIVAGGKRVIPIDEAHTIHFDSDTFGGLLGHGCSETDPHPISHSSYLPRGYVPKDDDTPRRRRCERAKSLRRAVVLLQAVGRGLIVRVRAARRRNAVFTIQGSFKRFQYKRHSCDSRRHRSLARVQRSALSSLEHCGRVPALRPFPAREHDLPGVAFNQFAPGSRNWRRDDNQQASHHARFPCHPSTRAPASRPKEKPRTTFVLCGPRFRDGMRTRWDEQQISISRMGARQSSHIHGSAGTRFEQLKFGSPTPRRPQSAASGIVPSRAARRSPSRPSSARPGSARPTSPRGLLVPSSPDTVMMHSPLHILDELRFDGRAVASPIMMRAPITLPSSTNRREIDMLEQVLRTTPSPKLSHSSCHSS